MSIFALFLIYMLAMLGLATVVVPALQPLLFDSLGLKPESSLYRFAMLAAAIGLPFFLRPLRLNSWTAAGYPPSSPATWRALGLGLLIGIGILLLLFLAQWALGVHHLAIPADKATAYYFIRTLLSGLLSGLAVGFIEETFFRGLMHTGMRRSLGLWPTAMLTGALYAGLHFMKPGDPPAGIFDTPMAADMILTGLGRVGDFAPIADSFITLMIAGMFLSVVRERTGSILWAIGIHAGWVAVIKVAKYLTDPTVVDGQTSALIGSYDNITGWMASVWLAALIVAYVWWSRRGASSSAPHQSA